MLHYLYLGHFQHDDPDLRLIKSEKDRQLRPAISRELDMALVLQAFRDVTNKDELLIPPDWCLWVDHGYIVCNQYTHSPQAIRFCVEVARQTHCDIWLDLWRRMAVEGIEYQWPK